MLFVSIAHAADTAAAAANQAAPLAPPPGGGLMQFLPLILIFVVFYFLMIRPQQKKMKEHQNMVSALSKGDQIITSGGIIGTVTKVNSDSEVTVEIADGVRVRIIRGMITARMEKDGSVSGDPQGVLSQGDGKKAA